jgi:hypothetical protein
VDVLFPQMCWGHLGAKRGHSPQFCPYFSVSKKFFTSFKYSGALYLRFLILGLARAFISFLIVSWLAQKIDDNILFLSPILLPACLR